MPRARRSEAGVDGRSDRDFHRVSGTVPKLGASEGGGGGAGVEGQSMFRSEEKVRGTAHEEPGGRRRTTEHQTVQGSEQAGMCEPAMALLHPS